MKRLFLLRHVKSSWDDAMLDDHERPLAPKGRRIAEQLCRYLLDQEISPALVLCSSALRTRQTLAELMPAIRAEATLRIERGLYGADAEALLRRIREVPEAAPTIMVIGHNPGMQDLAGRLAAGGAKASEIEESYPAGALAIFYVENGWSGLDARSATISAFVMPRDL
jgi:phosphohistidine phosphatase